MSATALRKRLTRRLLKEINEVQFPSVTMMDRVEAALGSDDDFEAYVEVLVKKVEETQYPSISLLNRLDGLLAQLEGLERQRQEASQDRQAA